MVTPQRIGRYLFPDADGLLIPDARQDNITGGWRVAVEFVTRRLMQSGEVQAVFVRGSVPRGLALKGVSDLDVLYFAEEDLEPLEDRTIRDAHRRFDFLSAVELERVTQRRFGCVNPPQTRPYLHMFLKTQAVCVAGEDFTRDIAPFRMGLDLVSHAFTLDDELDDVLADSHTRQWFSRRLVRSGLEITLDRMRRFSRDLYLCYEQFSEVYPEHAARMYSALCNCLSGDEAPGAFEDLVSLVVKERGRLLP
jgi:hypothetical protein